MDWKRVASSEEQAVTPSEIRALGHKLFVPTMFRIVPKLAQQLSARLAEKCQNP